MTEDEAKTKWCPSSKGPNGGFAQCITSDCMWWRWLPFQALDPLYIEAIKICETARDMKPPQAAKYVNAHRGEFGLPIDPFEGYCGLAGKP